MTVYNKKCVICNKEFTSEARGTRYCSEECCQKGQKKNIKVAKARKARRQQYASEKDIRRLVQRAYALALTIGDAFIPKVCACKDENCDGELQLHHKNHNPMDNSIENLMWVCTKHHAAIHSQEEDRDIVSELKEHWVRAECQEG